MTLAATLSTYVLVGAVSHGERGRWARYVATVVLLGGCSVIALLLLVPHALFVLAGRRRRTARAG